MSLIWINLDFLKIPNLCNIKIRLYRKIKEKSQQFQGIFTCSITMNKQITLVMTKIRVILEKRMVDSMSNLSIRDYFTKGRHIRIGKIIVVSLFNLFLIQIHLTAGIKFVNINKERQQKRRNLLWQTNHQEHLKIVLWKFFNLKI